MICEKLRCPETRFLEETGFLDFYAKAARTAILLELVNKTTLSASKLKSDRL
jgi:hypothetical protein